MSYHLSETIRVLRRILRSLLEERLKKLTAVSRFNKLLHALWNTCTFRPVGYYWLVSNATMTDLSSVDMTDGNHRQCRRQARFRSRGVVALRQARVKFLVTKSMRWVHSSNRREWKWHRLFVFVLLCGVLQTPLPILGVTKAFIVCASNNTREVPCIEPFFVPWILAWRFLSGWSTLCGLAAASS